MATADRWVMERSLHILADLAEDGRLSDSGGVAALAALLAGQDSNGSFASSTIAQAVASWALARVVETDAATPFCAAGLRHLPDHEAGWVFGAATRALASLLDRRLASGSWGLNPIDPVADPIATEWAEFATGTAPFASVPDLLSSLEPYGLASEIARLSRALVRSAPRSA